jgi:hypothetical protein
MEFSLTPAGHVLLDRVDELIELKLITSGVGPLRQILQRKRMSAFGVCVQPVSATPLVVYRLAFGSPRSFADVD